jgi:hypothetical protein
MSGVLPTSKHLRTTARRPHQRIQLALFSTVFVTRMITGCWPAVSCLDFVTARRADVAVRAANRRMRAGTALAV